MNKTVVTAFNESYIKLGAALIASIIEHNNDVDIIVLDIGISSPSKHKLSSWTKKKGVKIEFIEITNKLFLKYFGHDIHVPEQYEYYARLLVPYLLPPQINVILYLDADIICLSDFSEIFEINIGEKIIAAREDVGYKKFNSIMISRGTSIIPNYKELGISGESSYFNSGVMLINVQKWKSELISNKVLDLTFNNTKHVILWDQYGLNISLIEKWFNLEEKWNVMHCSKENDTIVFRHFAKDKPIHYKYPHLDKQTFFKYLDLSPWKNWRPNNLIFTYTRIKNFLSRFLKKCRKSLKNKS